VPLFDISGAVRLITRKQVPLRESPRLLVTGAETGPIVIERATLGALPQVNAMHRRCSPASRRARYHQSRESLRPAEWKTFCEPETGWTWLARPAANQALVIGMVSVLRYSDRASWDFSVLIDDGWQGRRVGTIMAGHAVASAQAGGVESLEAIVEQDNVRSLKLLRRLGASIRLVDAFTAEARISLRGRAVCEPPLTA